MINEKEAAAWAAKYLRERWERMASKPLGSEELARAFEVHNCLREFEELASASDADTENPAPNEAALFKSVLESAAKTVDAWPEWRRSDATREALEDGEEE